MRSGESVHLCPLETVPRRGTGDCSSSLHQSWLIPVVWGCLKGQGLTYIPGPWFRTQSMHGAA